jgi:hypothetical protein
MRTKLPLVLTVSTLLAILPTPSSAAEPPPFPGKKYFKTADGCGFLISDETWTSADANSKKLWDSWSKNHWLGSCRHGLIDGAGAWFDSSNEIAYSNFRNDTFVMGEQSYSALPNQKKFYTVELPNVYTSTASGGRLSFARPGVINYQLIDLEAKIDSGSQIINAYFPAAWNPQLRSKPVFNLNDESSGDDISFSYSGALPANEEYENQMGGMQFEALAKRCDDYTLKIKIKGCSSPYKVFDVYGIKIKGIKTAGVELYEERFIPCPNLQSPVGCDALWESNVGKYIDAMLAHAKLVSEKVAEQNAQLAAKSKALEAALPPSWKAHWAKNPINRQAVDIALQCREITDYGAASSADADYIQKKYSTPPCNSAVVARVVMERATNFLDNERQGANYKKQQIAFIDKFNRERDQATSEAWAGFFNTMNGVLNIHLQAEQQRINQYNAQIAAANQQSAAAPVYQSYGQPAASSPQSYDPSKVQIRAIHKPELDAGSCVKLVQLANGDPLSSFGSQVFSNQCGQTVEVFWCKVGDECERGAGGSWTVASGSSYPVSSGQYRYGACLGKNSGALVRDASGVHTGRYACTGP